MITILKEDIKIKKINHDYALLKIVNVNHNFSCVIDNLTFSHNQIRMLMNEIGYKLHLGPNSPVNSIVR